MKALVFEDKVVEVVANAKTFEVHESLVWMDAPEGCLYGWELDDGALVAPPAPPEPSYEEKRLRDYPSMADQLDYIYHNGIAKWKSDMVKPVKDAHPKPE